MAHEATRRERYPDQCRRAPGREISTVVFKQFALPVFESLNKFNWQRMLAGENPGASYQYRQSPVTATAKMSRILVKACAATASISFPLRE